MCAILEQLLVQICALQHNALFEAIQPFPASPMRWSSPFLFRPFQTALTNTAAVCTQDASFYCSRLTKLIYNIRVFQLHLQGGWPLHSLNAVITAHCLALAVQTYACCSTRPHSICQALSSVYCCWQCQLKVLLCKCCDGNRSDWQGHWQHAIAAAFSLLCQRHWLHAAAAAACSPQ